MQRTATYTILILRQFDGYRASCPALACETSATTQAEAYRAIKALVRRRLLDLIEDDRGLPSDPVVSITPLRLDLLELYEEVDLR